MQNFQPTLGIRETAQNINFFIDANRPAFWEIFKPLIPYILGFTLFDTIVKGLYFSEPNQQYFPIGELITAYFSMALVISWHRVVILGADNYTPMNPFRPKKDELAFLVMGVFLVVILVFIAAFIIGIALAIKNPIVTPLVIFAAVFFCVFVMYKVIFYFPAKAVDTSLTFRKSYSLTEGYLLKLILATILANMKLLLFAFLYIFTILIGGVFAASYIFGTGLIAKFIIFVLQLPLTLYFQPLMTVVGVTALSNYYMHALQNKNDAV